MQVLLQERSGHIREKLKTLRLMNMLYHYSGKLWFNPRSGRVITKTQKMVLDASLTKSQHFMVWIKCKWNNPEKGVATPPQHIGVIVI